MPSESKSAKGCLISLICVIEKIIHKANERQPGSSNHLTQLEKARHSNRVPGNPKNILEIIFFFRTKKLVLRACESVASHGRRDSAQLSSALSQSRKSFKATHSEALTWLEVRSLKQVAGRAGSSLPRSL